MGRLEAKRREMVRVMERWRASGLTARAFSTKERIPEARLWVEPGVEALATRYFEAIQLPGRARADALHLALATWHGVDFLVSWNCVHIASGRVRRILADVNRELGIRMPEICNPYELLEDEDDS